MIPAEEGKSPRSDPPTRQRRAGLPPVLTAVCLVVASIVVSPSVHGQTAPEVGATRAIGGMGGISSSKMVISEGGASVALDGHTGFSLGMSAEQRVSGPIHAEVDGMFVQKGFDVSSSNGRSWIKLSYIELPLLLRYEVELEEPGIQPFLVAGGWYAFKASCTVGVYSVGVNGTASCGKGVRASDNGLVVGAGVARRRLSAAIRYSYGLGSVIEFDDGTRAQNRVLMLLMGYRLSGGEN